MQITYTDAPADFDGFGTKTIAIVANINHCGTLRPVRKVETPDEHVLWQRTRYGSGMYLSASEEELPRVRGLFLPIS